MSEDNDDGRPKKRAKKNNATKHGVYSREVMLPGENIRSYRAFAAEFVEEWAPEGPTERSLVDRLVELHWRRQRLERYEHSKLQIRANQFRQHNIYHKRLEVLKCLGPKFEDALTKDDVYIVLDEVDQVGQIYSDHIEQNVPYDESPEALPWGPAIAKHLASLEPKARFEGPAMFVSMIDPSVIEKNMERSNRIDEAIDRTIKRLMQVKTAKQIFPTMRNAKDEPRLINVSRLAGPILEANENEQSVELLGKVEVFAKPTETLRIN
jgi:hypothetical protein